MTQVIRGAGKAREVFNALKQINRKAGHKTLGQIIKEQKA